MDEELVNKFGYSEMYEWSEIPNREYKLGRFVQFDPEYPGKIKLCADTTNIIGVTTVNSVVVSDNPDEWFFKNAYNEYGDIYLKKEVLSVGGMEYDQQKEISFIRTRKYEHYVPITTRNYNKDLKFVKRTKRPEWVKVNLLGKCIVEDDGTCQPGKYCTLYTGKIKSKQGTVTLADENSDVKFYVINRVSNKTVTILYKNI